MLFDFINSMFELGAAVMAWLNVVRILKDKKIHGVSRLSTAFFVGLGVWNMYYYPHLHQWFSFSGGLCIVTANAVWLYFMWKFRGNE